MSPIKKLIIIFAVVVFILFIAFIIAAWYLGVFATVDITARDSGPYYLVTSSELSPYQEISRKNEHLDIMLAGRGIKYENFVGILYNNPIESTISKLRIKGGVIVKDSVAVDSLLHFERINRRLVAVARLKAHPAIAPFKIYPALQEWVQLHNYFLLKEMTILEHYKEDGLVEVEIPIRER
jgi:hypothetical protein